MKTKTTLIIILLCSFLSNAQYLNSTFNEGTLEGWTNIDGSTDFLTVEEEGTRFYLNKINDGTNTPIGEMAIINTSNNWTGNYFYFPTGTSEEVRALDNIFMRNENDFDIYLRCGFTGSNGYKVVVTDPVIIPALSDWYFYGFYYIINFPNLENLTILNDIDGIPYEEVFNNVHDLFSDVVEVKLFHNETIISYDGEIVNGTLQIDKISSIELLGVNEIEKSNFKLYPNPVNEELNISFLKDTDGIMTIYNILGEEVLTKNVSGVSNQINVSNLQSGIYLVNITSENSSVTKKVVKF